MADPQTPVPGKERTGYPAPPQDASTQTTWNLLKTRDASTQTAEESISQKTTQDASTQTPADDLSRLEQPPAALETSEENKKRRISKVEDITPGSDVGKLPRTETSRMVHEFDSSLNVLPLHSGNTRNINTQENAASKKTISKKENAPCEKSDTDVSKVKNVFSVENILALPGPSRCLEIKSPSKSYVEKPPKESPPKQQPSVQTEQKQPLCLACKQTISKHTEGNHLDYTYNCCRCNYADKSFNYLQIHVYNEHTKYHSCPVCQMDYSDVNSHVPGGTCELCEGDTNFECRYKLEEHYISEHKAFLETNCRFCKRKFDDHLTAEVVDKRQTNKYQCCFTDCKQRCNCTSSLNRHLSTHSPLKLNKCELCDGHFKVLGVHKENSHLLCTFCEKRFVNIFFLNEHLCEKHKEE